MVGLSKSLLSMSGQSAKGFYIVNIGLRIISLKKIKILILMIHSLAEKVSLNLNMELISYMNKMKNMTN